MGENAFAVSHFRGLGGGVAPAPAQIQVLETKKGELDAARAGLEAEAVFLQTRINQNIADRTLYKDNIGIHAATLVGAGAFAIANAQANIDRVAKNMAPGILTASAPPSLGATVVGGVMHAATIAALTASDTISGMEFNNKADEFAVAKKLQESFADLLNSAKQADERFRAPVAQALAKAGAGLG